jgi:hypothetical protein
LPLVFLSSYVSPLCLFLFICCPLSFPL